MDGDESLAECHGSLPELGIAGCKMGRSGPFPLLTLQARQSPGARL